MGCPPGAGLPAWREGASPSLICSGKRGTSLSNGLGRGRSRYRVSTVRNVPSARVPHRYTGTKDPLLAQARGSQRTFGPSTTSQHWHERSAAGTSTWGVRTSAPASPPPPARAPGPIRAPGLIILAWKNVWRGHFWAAPRGRASVPPGPRALALFKLFREPRHLSQQRTRAESLQSDHWIATLQRKHLCSQCTFGARVPHRNTGTKDQLLAQAPGG